ncbi:MAG: hypothetical protein V1809_15320 [Planctomycetota bacterium]
MTTRLRFTVWVLAWIPVMGCVLAAGSACAGDKTEVSASEGVKLIRSFEPDEMVGNASRDPVAGKHWKFVGKFWEGEGIPVGWRVKDHLSELTVPADHDGPVTLYVPDGSRDHPDMSLYRTGATQGKYSFLYRLTDHKCQQAKKPFVTGCPPFGGYHDVYDWYFQRESFVWKEKSGDKPMDWSVYNRIRFDVLSSEAPAVLGVKVRDRSCTRLSKQGLSVGIRTDVAVFKIPAGKQVVCEYPLAEMARVAEMDTSKIDWMFIRLNGFEGKTDIFIDNIRLLVPDAKDEVKGELIKMEGEPRPFARRVWDKNPPPRDRTTFKRETGPVEKLGPVTVYEGGGNHACAPAHFGGNGETYGQSIRRGVVAWDNKRLLVIFGGKPHPEAPKITWGGAGEYSQTVVLASFDGGKTWGGLQPGDKGPVQLDDWYWRASASSDGGGDLYYVGTENCDSYVEGHDVFFRRLGFTGDGWEYDRMTIVDQNEYKCPGPARALRLSTGRIWTVWTDGWNGVWSKYSDDDGLTWAPCKDASIKEFPRPLYVPKLEDLGKPNPPKPPATVLLWPAEPAAGSLLAPYKGQVAVIAYDGTQWASHDGKAWGATQKVPWKNGKGSQAAEAVLGEDRIFLARAENDNTVLSAIRLEGGAWQEAEELDKGKFGSSILTASGESVFCFYVKVEGEDYNVYSRRWKGGKWEPAEKIGMEKEQICQLAAPTVSPPDYAPVFWDQLGKKGIKSTWIRFARIPNK